MNRRRLLELLGGLTAAVGSGRHAGWFGGFLRGRLGVFGNSSPSGPARRGPFRRSSDRVVVAGAGILGSSIAYHLARRGADVTLLEKERPSAGATGKSFAWLNATFVKQPWSYHLLNRLSLESWRHLQQEWNGELEVQWGGSLEWYGDPERARELRGQVRKHQAWGYPAHLVDEAGFQRLEPDVEPGSVLAASFCPQEGSVDPVHAVDVFLKNASKHGAQIVHPCEVTGVDLTYGRLRAVRSTQGDFECDVLVVCCGTDTPRVAEMAGIDVALVDSPGILAHTTPRDRSIQRVILAPGAHMKQTVDGRVVTGVGFGGTPSTDNSREYGERALSEASRFLPSLRGAGLDKVTLGWRPLPSDGHPIVGFPEGSPEIYLAVMHSGMTLAPLIGRLVAMEILDGVEVALLDDYRLARFG